MWLFYTRKNLLKTHIISEPDEYFIWSICFKLGKASFCLNGCKSCVCLSCEEHVVYMHNENLMRMPDVHVYIKGSHFAFHCRWGAANLRRCSIMKTFVCYTSFHAKCVACKGSWRISLKFRPALRFKVLTGSPAQAVLFTETPLTSASVGLMWSHFSSDLFVSLHLFLLPIFEKSFVWLWRDTARYRCFNQEQKACGWLVPDAIGNGLFLQHILQPALRVRLCSTQKYIHL